MSRREMMTRRTMRDGRNPYGSRGGYVSSRRPDRARSRMDMRGGSRGYSPDYNMSTSYGGGERDFRHMGYEDYESDYAQGRYGREPSREYNRGSVYPFEMRGALGKFDGAYGRRDYAMYDDDDYMYDGHAEGEMLSNQELKQWSYRLQDELDEKDKQLLRRESVLKKAEDMGIRFDKFTEMEFYVTVLMMFTDYSKTLGTANIDVYLRLAKDWLCDEDASVKYGEKLAMYYDSIIGDM